MKATQYFLAAFGIPALAVATFSVGRWYRQEFTHIPEKRMRIDGRNTRRGVIVAGNTGVATIISPKFTIAFEGESFYPLSLIKSQYQVDGRYGGLFPPDSDPLKDDMGDGVTYQYSAQTREATITYKNDRFVYCDYLNTLRANGMVYSTAHAPVQLWVSKQGKIKQVR